MRELANRGDSKIDEASVIQCVINGIDGPRSDKIILYGATSFSEFKQKLRTYETVIKIMGIHYSNSPNFRHSYESRGRDFNKQSFQRKPTRFNVSGAAKNPQRYFNSNDIGHLSKSCPNHSRGLRYLSCNLYGHKSFECRQTNLNNTSTPPFGVNAVHKLPSSINMCKDVTIFSRKLNGLADTGSNLTLTTKRYFISHDVCTFAERDIMSAQVDEWIENGIVEPCSSPYASQDVVVKIKEGKSRVCIDYRLLNHKLIKDITIIFL
ncbi:retrovirus-related Pol polyprotein from transposon 297 [Trichonephila clavipes]|uniref:Retrovirus-related Pol polyprotein from transposon 297 n=1 Tax=Trichonephila clavipes TaxID=2585209 RepID=A0A8X6VJP1_TRICX|nr:retrovirus-related Pol polyprotein from transposon 297 [Trichonephila clavipes]